MTIGVLVPTTYRHASLRRCLEALGSQNRPIDQLVVVHRRDDAAAAQVLVDARRCNPLANALEEVIVELPGKSLAINAGLAVVRTDIICFTDDDAEPLVDWTERIEQALTDERVGGVGGRDIVYNNEKPDDDTCSVVGQLTWYGRIVGNHHLCLVPPTVRQVSILKGVNMAFRREALDGFRLDPALGWKGAFHDEVDYCLYVRNRGKLLLYDPALQVIHRPAPRNWSADRRNFDVIQFESTFNLTYLLLKHLSWPRKIAFLVYSLLIGQRTALGLITFPYILTRRDKIYGQFPAGARLQAIAYAGKLAAIYRLSIQALRAIFPPHNGNNSQNKLGEMHVPKT